MTVRENIPYLKRLLGPKVTSLPELLREGRGGEESGRRNAAPLGI